MSEMRKPRLWDSPSTCGGCQSNAPYDDAVTNLGRDVVALGFAPPLARLFEIVPSDAVLARLGDQSRQRITLLPESIRLLRNGLGGPTELISGNPDLVLRNGLHLGQIMQASEPIHLATLVQSSVPDRKRQRQYKHTIIPLDLEFLQGHLVRSDEVIGAKVQGRPLGKCRAMRWVFQGPTYLVSPSLDATGATGLDHQGLNLVTS